MQLEKALKRGEGKVIVRFTFNDHKEWKKHSEKLHRVADDMKATISVAQV